MLLATVSELLARVGRHPALEQTLDSLRHGVHRAHLAGLTDTAKALVVALAASELRRPVIYLVESNLRADALAEPAAAELYRSATGGDR